MVEQDPGSKTVLIPERASIQKPNKSFIAKSFLVYIWLLDHTQITLPSFQVAVVRTGCLESDL